MESLPPGIMPAENKPAETLSGAVSPPERSGVFKLSPINRRRWRNFKANRRGYVSLWIFGILFGVSLFAEFIANDKPILVSYKGELLVPVLVDYPETKFGGFFATTNYRSSTIAREIEANGWMIWPPIRYSYKEPRPDPPVAAPVPPTWLLSDEQCASAMTAKPVTSCRDIEWNWLGTDDQIRDVLARAIYGFRLSLLFGLVLTFFSSIVGVTAGAIQGYFGGWIDLSFQRFIEIWTSVPELYVIIIFSAFFEPGFFILLGILLLFSWVKLVGLVRAEFLRARNFEYVRAAKALGLANRLIIVRHVLPNAMVATLTYMPLILVGSISTLTALDYLGFGLPPTYPSLGELLNQGRVHALVAPWIGLTAFFVLATMLSLLIFIGEAVRDAFDPRKTFA